MLTLWDNKISTSHVKSMGDKISSIHVMSMGCEKNKVGRLAPSMLTLWEIRYAFSIFLNAKSKLSTENPCYLHGPLAWCLSSDFVFFTSHRHNLDGAYLISHRVNMNGAYILTLHFLYTLLAWFFHRILLSRLFEKMFSSETNHRVFFFLSYISWETRWSLWLVRVKLRFFSTAIYLLFP